MTPAERFGLECQARAWLRAMRIAWVKRHGIERGDCPVQVWEDLSPADRGILIIAQAAANKAGTPEAVEAARMRAKHAATLAAQ